MRLLGATYQLSIADVECKHAYNRMNGSCTFPSVCSKFINREAKMHVSQALARAHGRADKIVDSTSRLCLANRQLQPKKKAGARGQGALHWFRYDWLQRQMTNVTDAAERRKLVVGAESWKLCKEEPLGYPSAPKA